MANLFVALAESVESDATGPCRVGARVAIHVVSIASPTHVLYERSVSLAELLYDLYWMFFTATDPWSPWIISGLVARSSAKGAARVGPVTSTFSCTATPFTLTFTKRALAILV